MANCTWDNENGPRKCTVCGFVVTVNVAGPVYMECGSFVVPVDTATKFVKVTPLPPFTDERRVEVIAAMQSSIDPSLASRLAMCNACPNLDFYGCTNTGGSCANCWAIWRKMIQEGVCPNLSSC
jgi:hypothetical protein